MLGSDLCHFIKIGLDDFLKVAVKILVRGVGGSLGLCGLSILRGFERKSNTMGVFMVVGNICFGSE